MGHGVEEREHIVYVKLVKGKQGETPEFIYKENKVESTGDYLSGYITGFELSDYMYKEKKRETFIINLVDDGKKYKFESTYTSLGRSLINCLMTVETPGKIKFKLAGSKTAEDYPSVFVTNDDSKALGWKWKYDQLKDFITGEGEDKDSTKLDQMWAGCIMKTLHPLFQAAYAKMVAAGPAAPNAVPVAEGPPAPPAPAPSQVGDSIAAKDIDVTDQIPASDPPPAPEASATGGEDPPPTPDKPKDDLPF